VSKFAGLFDEPKPKPARKVEPKPAVKQDGAKRARAMGKRSDPAFTQITAYLRKADLPDFKAKLEKAGRDMSDFFQEKMNEYLRT
jgi:hypothetical protein